MAKRSTHARSVGKRGARRAGIREHRRTARTARARSIARASKRSAAAKKGWATRRAKAAKRSAAAKKGWATRRAKAAKQKRPRQPKPLFREFAVSADYRARRHNSAVSVQIAMRAPADATKDDLTSAIERAIDTNGQDIPPGWEIHLINWRGHDYTGGPIRTLPQEREADAWRALSGPLALADLDIRSVGKGGA